MDNEMLALYKEANRKWNEKEHLMRNVLRYKDAPRASIGESDRCSLLQVGLTDDDGLEKLFRWILANSSSVITHTFATKIQRLAHIIVWLAGIDVRNPYFR